MRLEVQKETRGDTTYLKCPLCRHTLVTDGASLSQHLQSVHRATVQWKYADEVDPKAEKQATRGNRQARRGSLKQADTPPATNDQNEPSSDEQDPA